MARVSVLLEVVGEVDSAFEMHTSAMDSESESQRQADQLVQNLSGYGLDYDDDMTPIPLFTEPGARPMGLSTFAETTESADQSSLSTLVECSLDAERVEDLERVGNYRVWPNSQLTLFQDTYYETIDEARADGGTDCRPFRDAATLTEIRHLLGVDSAWQNGHRGQNIVVGIIDEGVNGEEYPVVGGFARPNAGRRPGTAPITSHGSMCAADVLIAAPWARIYDYPFLGVPRSGGAIQMFQAVLDQRRLDGTPHLTSNSYGFVGVPDRQRFPNHEVHDIDHPVHRKVREVVTSGASCFFAAGNCGEDCPSGACHFSGIGPGNSIHASNSLNEVVTVAAVNKFHERIGYSSQGPGRFELEKPDVAAYSHIFANFGPGRPAAGDETSFDNGTSAATPVVAGVAALILSAYPDLSPTEIKQVLIASAVKVNSSTGWNAEYGHGIVNVAAALAML